MPFYRIKFLWNVGTLCQASIIGAEVVCRFTQGDTKAYREGTKHHVHRVLSSVPWIATESRCRAESLHKLRLGVCHAYPAIVLDALALPRQ